MRFKMMVLAAVAVSLRCRRSRRPIDRRLPRAAQKEKKFCRRYAVTGSIVGTPRGVPHQERMGRDRRVPMPRNASDTLDDSRLRNSNPLAK